MNQEEKIKRWFEENPDVWISTREARMKFEAEGADRRMRSLRAKGFKIICRRREINGKKYSTFFWAHPSEGQQKLEGI